LAIGADALPSLARAGGKSMSRTENLSAINAAAAAKRLQEVQTTAMVTAAVMRGSVAAIMRALRHWRVRERQRRELSQMKQRDFGDLVVPQSLAVEELRRWPWQKSSPQWGTVRDGQPANGVEERQPRRTALGSLVRRIRLRETRIHAPYRKERRHSRRGLSS
jgi:uncharacterized protein YjiS (DUF1127 family)